MKTFILYICLAISCCCFVQAQKATNGNDYDLFAAHTKVKSPPAHSDNIESKRAFYVSRIFNYFPEQLTNPQAKKRHSLSQFGYIFPMREFIVPGNFGQHSYGKPSRKERNGCVYTCKGGFIDFSHLRVALDWTVYLTFRILTEENDFSLTPEAGMLELHFKNMERLSLEDISSIAQKIAFERLVWHEVASWHYHPPYRSMSEQLSAFTPEDLYSNAIGTVIGKNVALRLLTNIEGLTYSEVATEEIEKYILSLEPLATKRETINAYKLVDLTRQQKLPEAKRNNDVWWESRIIFLNQRYVFKRYMNIGPQLEPWLITEAERLKCPAQPESAVINIPQKTKSGKSLYNYYEFKITPDKKMFISKGPEKNHHTAIEPFITRDFEKVIAHVRNEMQRVLPEGCDERNNIVPSSANR